MRSHETLKYFNNLKEDTVLQMLESNQFESFAVGKSDLSSFIMQQKSQLYSRGELKRANKVRRRGSRKNLERNFNYFSVNEVNCLNQELPYNSLYRFELEMHKSSNEH